MSRPTVTRLFVGAVVTTVAGWILAIVAVISGLAGGAVTLGGPSVVTINGAAFASALVVLAIAGVLVAAGTIAAFVSWIAALLATYPLEDKTWFVALLVLGLWSFGFVAMIAYVVAGPDTPASAEARPRIATSAGD